MKRLTIFALGSRGDVQPYTALGKGLQDAGYRVRVATFESFRGMVEGQGLDFHPVRGDAQALLQGSMSRDSLGTRNPIRTMRAIMSSYGAVADDYIAAFSSDALFDSDGIINQLPGALFGLDLAEKLRVPHIAASVIPLVPTRAFPNPLLSASNGVGAFNRLSYRFAAQLVWFFFRPKIAVFRRMLGLSSPARLLRLDGYPVLNGFSPHVIPPPTDWGRNIYTTGYWTLTELDWTPPAPLLDFLRAGSPPVFIGFGSMFVADPTGLTRTILEAVQLSGQCAVLYSGWANLGGASLPDTVYCLDYAPYLWLFPQMAAVIHHGGSGTTGLALGSGVPSMVVPFTADQPFWGRRTQTLGVGAAPIPIKQLTAERLAAAIRHMVNDTAMRERAAQLGAAIRQENGLGEAVRIVQHIVGM
ncbi:MAG: glycosyltransferase family 1 protein [Anaerolineae bacterium]|nr:glycosyltransferase family 1 protein [Anaerolineae bacterium]